MGLAQQTLGRIDLACGKNVEAERHLNEALQTFTSIWAQFQEG
jgi:hypothetical protein